MKAILLIYSLFMVVFIVYGVYHFLNNDIMMMVAFLLFAGAAAIRVSQTVRDINRNNR